MSFADIIARVQAEQRAAEAQGGLEYNPDTGSAITDTDFQQTYVGKLKVEDDLVVAIGETAELDMDDAAVWPLSDLYNWLALVAQGDARGVLTVHATWTPETA